MTCIDIVSQSSLRLIMLYDLGVAIFKRIPLVQMTPIRTKMKMIATKLYIQNHRKFENTYGKSFSTFTQNGNIFIPSEQ